MLKAKVTLKKRKQDAYGSGEYGASRAGGRRVHNGCDYVANVGDDIYPIKAGRVTKLGYPYTDDPSIRYVQVTDENGRPWRYFYINPLVQLGDFVTVNTSIGTLQDLQKRYPKDKNHKEPVTNHCHVEIKLGKNSYINPEEVN